MQKNPTDVRGRHFQDQIVVLCVRWYLRYCLTLRDLEEMMAERGLGVDHSTIGRWVLRYAPELQNGFAARLETPTARGGSTKPTSASLGNGPIYVGPWIPPAKPSTSSSRPSAMPSWRSIFYRWPCGEWAGSDRE
jgi:hypothetical protein